MVGEVKMASVNFDQNGRSKGTAEVLFARRHAGLLAQFFSPPAAHMTQLAPLLLSHAQG